MRATYKETMSQTYIVPTEKHPRSVSETLHSRAVLPDHGLDLLPYLCGCDVAHRRGSLRILTCPAHFQRVAS